MSAFKGYRADGFAHAVHRHHFPGDGGCPLDVAARSGGNVPQAQLLRHPAPQKGHDPVFHIPLGEEGPVLLRQGDGHAPRLPPGNNGDLVHRVVFRQGLHHHGVARLVPGGQLPLVPGDHPAALLRARQDLDLRLVEILHSDIIPVPPGSQQGSLVHHVLQVRPGKSGGAPGQGPKVHILGQGFPPDVDFQNILPALDVGESHVNLAVKPPGAQQGRVQHVHPVGGRQDHHPLVGGEAVHLHQKLVQGLFPLVVSAAHAGAPLAAHGVNFVNEHNGGGGLFRLFKKVPDPAGAHAHVQLHKIGAGDGEKAHSGLPGHGLGKQGFPRARRADQKHALGDSGPQGDEPPGVPKELHDFLKLLLLLLRPGHVLEADLFVLFRKDPGPGGTEAGHAVRPHAAPLAPEQEEVSHAAHQSRRQKDG